MGGSAPGSLANGEQQKQANYQRMIADANEFLSRMEKKRTRMANLLEIARSYAMAGLSVIPVAETNAHGSSGLNIRTILRMSETFGALGLALMAIIAIVTGKVSGNLLVIDFDEPRFTRLGWKELENARRDW